jgi:hypothetical protein
LGAGGAPRHCDHGLLPAPGGHGYVLACPPAVEADIYHGSTEHGIYDAIAAVQAPVVVVRGHPSQLTPAIDLSASPTAVDLAAHFPSGRDIHLADHTHFIPMEDPALVAELIERLA